MTTAAEKIIAKLGGPKAVAAIARVDVSAVHRWGYPRERGGTGGRIPSRHQQQLLDHARANGIDLSPSDFFEQPVAADAAA